MRYRAAPLPGIWSEAIGQMMRLAGEGGRGQGAEGASVSVSGGERLRVRAGVSVGVMGTVEGVWLRERGRRGRGGCEGS